MCRYFTGLCLIIFLSVASSNNYTHSIVRIYTTSNAYNYKSPWASPQQYEQTGTGFIISGNRIITNAHVISDSVYIEVRRTDDVTPYQSEVLMVDHDCDLAILKVHNKKFFAKAVPLQFGSKFGVGERVSVHGFPIGGDEISLTEGVVSRIEMQEYLHSGQHLLLAQIDAAINPGNSGGPVISDGKVVGVATQGYSFGQNIGYMIPLQVLKHFLQDANASKYKGFPNIGISVQTMENETLRELYKLNNNQAGILVNKISREFDKIASLKTDDVILSIDGVNISNNGTVLLENNLRVRADYLISRAYIGDKLKLDIMRNGQKQTINVPLKFGSNLHRLVHSIKYEVSPTYYLHGGLVFQPLTVNYLQSFGGREKWGFSAPPQLTHYFMVDEEKEKRLEIVVLNKVLPDQANLGYQYVRDQVITKVNGKAVLSMRDLINKIESNKGKYLIFETEDNSKIVLDAKQVIAREQAIMKRFNIVAARSKDLE